MKVTKKPISVRLNPGTIEQINELQHKYFMNGFNASKADVIEDAIHQLYKKTFAEDDNDTK